MKKLLCYILCIALMVAGAASAQYQTFRGIWYPHPDNGVNYFGPDPSTPFRSYLIDNTGEDVCFIFAAPKTGTLQAVGFLLGAVTQAPTSGLNISFQDVDVTNGACDGTPDQFAVVTAGLTANSWVDVNTTGYMGSTGAGSGTKRAVTVGDLVGVLIGFESFAASDSLNIRSVAMSSTTQRFPYLLHDSGAGLTKQTNVIITLDVEYDDGSRAFIPYNYPWSGTTNTTFGSGSTPDERANAYTFLSPVKVNALCAMVDADNAVDLVLYESVGTAAGTALATVSIDPDIRSSLLPGIFCVPIAEQTLTTANTYRLAIKPTTASTVIAYQFAFSEAAAMDNMEGGQVVFLSTRTNGGTWTDTATSRQAAWLVISAIQDGTGGAGGGTGRVVPGK